VTTAHTAPLDQMSHTVRTNKSSIKGPLISVHVSISEHYFWGCCCLHPSRWSMTDQQLITHEDEHVTGIEIHWPAAAASRSPSRTDTSMMLRCWPPSWHLRHITTQQRWHAARARAARLFLRDARGGSNNCDWLILLNAVKSNICLDTLTRANDLRPK